MKIINLNRAGEIRRDQAARILHAGFKDTGSHEWRTLGACRAFTWQHTRAPLVALGVVIGEELAGWVAAQWIYGVVWEVEVLVVAPDHQRRGVGQALMAEIEARSKARGAQTMFLGSDDENFRTTASQSDLYKDIPGAIAGLADLTGHPFPFYQKLGYTVVGFLPDANGQNKPDIFMAKRL